MERAVIITYYGMIAERLALNSETVELPKNCTELRPFLMQLRPELADFRFSIAVDLAFRETIDSENQVKTIDVMPPFAGG